MLLLLLLLLLMLFDKLLLFELFVAHEGVVRLAHVSVELLELEQLVQDDGTFAIVVRVELIESSREQLALMLLVAV